MNLESPTRLLTLLLAGGFFVSDTHADDWPQFLGPNGDGTSDETGLIESFPVSGPVVNWSREIGSGYSAPSVVDDKVVIFHRIDDEEIVEVLETISGVSVWKHGYPTKYIDPYRYSNGPRCSPLIRDGFVYTFGAEGKLTCLRLDDGSLVWQRDTAAEFEVPEAFFGVGSTPVLHGNLLLTMVGGQPNSGMAAFNARTGETVWENVGESNWTGQVMHGWRGERTVEWRDYWKQASYASPVLTELYGQPVLYCFMRQGLVALNPNNGEEYDSFWFRAEVDESVNAINPVVSGNRVLISSAYYRAGAVLLELNEQMQFEPIWRNTNLEIHWSTPTLHDGRIYAFSGRNPPDASFRCVDFKTGELLWEREESWRRPSPPPDAFGRGSVITADDKLIVLGECGLLGLYRFNASEPEEVSRWQVPDMAYPCWTGPVLADQQLYLRCEGRLISLDFSRQR